MNNDNKATIIGVVLASLSVAQAFFNDVGFNLHTDWYKLAVAVGIAALGYYTNKKP
jgi:hypothetical protein